MRTYLDCIPCLTRQTLEAARMVSDDEVFHQRLLAEILQALSTIDMSLPPPAMARLIHGRIRELSGNPDPYREIKQRFNRMAWELLPALKKKVVASTSPLEMAVRAAIAGNVIDFGAKAALREEDVQAAMEQCLTVPLAGDFGRFAQRIHASRQILYLADNAGEIVFDRLLLEQLAPRRVTVAVKGGPIINDALLADAEEARIGELAEVIDNGSGAPGTILDDCSPRFRRRFDEAELIIAKGQANYETLSDVPRPIFFLLQVKCPMIARNLGQPLGRLLLAASRQIMGE